MRAKVGWILGLIVGGCALAWVDSACAQAPLQVSLARPKQLRVDGALGDWRGVPVAQVGGDDQDASADVALAYDARGLYVGASVRDDAFVRSAHPGLREDALVLTLALPVAGRFRRHELWLFAGHIGESAASLQLVAAGSKRPAPIKAARIVEGPSAGGYVIEAYVPWSSLPQADTWPLARGVLWLHDVDRAGGPARDVPAAARGARGQALPWLVFDGGPIQALRAFAADKNLGAARPSLDFVGDVRGDVRAEHVVVVGTYLWVGGLGREFTFTDLPVSRSADVLSAQLRDLTGDRRPELLLRSRTHNELGSSELFRVFDLQTSTPRECLTIETRRQTSVGSAVADLDVVAGVAGRPAQIRVRVGRVQGLTAADVPPTRQASVVGLALPWGSWIERSYAWDGQRYALVDERPNPKFERDRAPQPATASPPVTTRAPKAAAAAFSASAMFDAYRRARAVPQRQRPRFSQRANIAGDARLESLALFGRECVIVGEGFRAGQGFFYFNLPVHEGTEVRALYTADVTGDGHADVFARVRQTAGPVTREVLYVYGVADQGLQPLLAVEVSRKQAGQQIVNNVALVPGHGRKVLQVSPGKAIGWSAANYPFLSPAASDPIAPLLLPWKDGPARFLYDGHRLVPRLSSD